MWLPAVLLPIIFLIDGSLGGYLITTPRKWQSGGQVQVCVYLDSPGTLEDNLVLSVLSNNKEFYVEEKNIGIAEGERSFCTLLDVPPGNHRSATLVLRGTLDSSNVKHEQSVTLTESLVKAFIQTDKGVYKGGQSVQFRLLTISGPFGKVDTEGYSEVWVETPTGSRIAQWLNVTASDGLVHEEFTLTDEPEEGTYRIKASGNSGASGKGEFKVEEYVLPRFKVEIVPPKYILGSDEFVTFEVCADYTFGQPVKGTVTLTVNNNAWGKFKSSVEKVEEITGCQAIDFNSTELNINSINYYSYKLTADAEVTEDGTETTLKAESVTVDISRTAISFSNVGRQEFFKPELPYFAEIKAQLPDDSPASGEDMKVCIGDVCRHISTDINGILRFTIPPHLMGAYVTVDATGYPTVKDEKSSWRSIMYASRYSETIKQYHSPSNSSLVMALDDAKLDCVPGNLITLFIPVLFASNKQNTALINYQVVSRGRIQYDSSIQTLFENGEFPIMENTLIEAIKPSKIEMTRGSFNASISLPITISPKAQILMWYARTDGEVVSDVREVEVSKCLPHQTSLEWSHSMAQPGDEVSLTLNAEPGALCSLGVVDKSVNLLSSGSTKLSINNVFELFSKGDVLDEENRQLDDNKYCRQKEKTDSPTDPDSPVAMPEIAPPGRIGFSFYFTTSDVDALYMFHKAGLFAFSDLTIESRPCNSYSQYPTVLFDEGIRFSAIPQAAPEIMYKRPPVAAAGAASVPEGALVDFTHKKKETVPRTSFPETWLWELYGIGSDGKFVNNLALPDTVTEWVGSAVCAHPLEGVGLTGPATITAFRTFFVDLTLPAFVKRGEVFPLKVSVFNYLDTPLPIIMLLENSPEYTILDSSEETIPRVGRGVLQPGERHACVAAKDKVVFTLRIRPEVLGDMNMTVLAAVDQMGAKDCTNEEFEARSDVVIKPVKVEAEGFPIEKTWSKYICSKDIQEGNDILESWNIRPEEDTLVVEGSERAWLTAVGDLMGPTIENLGKLIRMPYGCGEQNMLNFAPNIFVMQYLEASGLTTQQLHNSAIKYMNKGYQRELTYRHKDGSYSAFGESDASGSTWLTAFVVKSYAQARSFINIDTKDLTKSTIWLRRKQLENGCFESVGKILHKGMKGGISGSESPSLLTSYVLISLLEAGKLPSSKVVKEALNCIRKAKTTTTYSLALKAYAMALAKSQTASDAVNQLMNRATVTTNSISWPPKDDSSDKSLGVALETAGYALLALMAHDPKLYATDGRLIVKWMSSQRNGQGGFISTQDTIVSLQAMAAYESSLLDEALNAKLIVDISNQQELSYLQVNEFNKLLVQRIDFESPASVTVNMEGTGCVLVQGILRYNIAKPQSSQAFALNVSTTIEPGVACKTHRITACASYLLPDGASNMAIIEVAMVSGFIPEKKDLKAVIGNGKGVLKRYEVDGNKVSFYVDELTEKELCVAFRMLRAIEVEDAKPGSVIVYDYYKPEDTISESYSLSKECLVPTVMEIR